VIHLFSQLRNMFRIVIAFILLIAGIYLASGEALLYADQSNNQGFKDNEIRKIETDLAKEREQLLRFHEKEKQLLKELSRLEGDAEKKRRILVVLHGKINSHKTELEKARAGLHDLDITQRDVQKRLNLRLVAFYKNAKRGYLHLLTSSTDLDQLQKWIKYFNMIMAEDQALIKEMNVLQVKKLQELTLLKEKISVIDNLERTENERLVSLKQDNEIKIVLLMKIHKEKEFYATAVTELELASKKLKETIVSLDHQEIKISQSSSFAAARGKLFPPIEGRIVEVEKAATDNFNKIYKGIYIEGSTGDEVKAIFDGKIDYSGLLKGYGQIIVINHGSRYFTVSAHLGQRFKEKGDRVRKGEVIGLLESVESKIQPRLYFEIRQGGTSLSPLEWLKLH